MAGKVSTSVSLDEDLAERIREDSHINASGIVNSVLREYYSVGTVDGLEFRLRRVERDLEEARDEVRRLEQERKELLSKKREQEAETEAELESRLELLSGIGSEHLGPDNPAIVNHANDLGMRPTQLVEEIRSYSG